MALVVACAATAGARADETVLTAMPSGYIVAPFENRSPVKALDWQTSALAATLAEKLESHAGLRPAYGPSILDGMDYAFDAEKVARRARDSGARWVFAGSFARPNWKAELGVRLYTVLDPSNEVPNPSLRLVAESSSVGERGDVLKMLDDNLAVVLRKGGLGVEAEAVAGLKRRPTKDLYALTLYGRALNLFFGLGLPKDATKAITLFKKVNLIDPKMAEAHRMLGIVYLDQGQRERAQGQYSYALDLKPGYYQAMAGLARLYRAEGNRTRAQELVEKSLELRPYDIEMREMFGEILWENAELDRALAELEKVVAVAPNHLQARRTLALVYAAKGATNDLAAELERITQLAPEDVDVRLDLGSAYQRMGDNVKAITSYEEVLKKDPKNVQALKFVGDCYRRGKEPDKAIAAYQRVMKIAPSDPRPYFLLGAVYQETGNDNKAEQVFQDAQQFKRYLGEAWTNLGAIAYRRGDLSKATWYLSRAVVKAPTRPKGHYNYALLLSAKKERDKALDELKIAGDLDPQDPEIRYLAGVILLRQGRLDDAKQMFEEALKRQPQHADAKHNLALLEDLEKRYGGEHAGSGAR
ncbi:MAG: Tetratricopeptide 2 repeat protein [Myxococcales bacterium]|nr:Tetratricopeptide 2 repeat protein [Myxococcales bacterium]